MMRLGECFVGKIDNRSVRERESESARLKWAGGEMGMCGAPPTVNAKVNQKFAISNNSTPSQLLSSTRGQEPQGEFSGSQCL